MHQFIRNSRSQPVSNYFKPWQFMKPPLNKYPSDLSPSIKTTRSSRSFSPVRVKISSLAFTMAEQLGSKNWMPWPASDAATIWIWCLKNDRCNGGGNVVDHFFNNILGWLKTPHPKASFSIFSKLRKSFDWFFIGLFVFFIGENLLSTSIENLLPMNCLI